MNLNINKIIQNILLTETVEKFGEPKGNRSKVVCACHECGLTSDTNVASLKRRLKKHGWFLCSQCVYKKTWTPERKLQISLSQKAKWKDIEYRQSRVESLRRLWEDAEYVEKHSESCKKSMTEDRKLALSRSSKKAWEDPGYRQRQSQSRKLMWQDSDYISKQEKFKNCPEWRRQQSDIQKKVSSDPEYRKARSEKQKLVWKNPEYASMQSEKQKLVWENPEYVAMQSEKQKMVWENHEHRAKFEILWKDPSHRSKLSDIIKKKWHDRKYRSRSVEAAKARWENDIYRQKVKSAIALKWKDPEYRQRMSDMSKRMWEDDSFRERVGAAIASQSGKMSSIEETTRSILSQIGVEFTHQSSVGPYVFDFHLPSKNIYIECQGEYRHSLPGRQSRDSAKFSYLEKSNPSSRLLYLQERDFMNPLHVSSKIRKFVFGEVDHIEQIDFDFSQVHVCQVDKKEASKFFNSFHYAGFGRTAKSVMGAFLDGQLIAACKFSSVVRKEVATSMGMEPGDVVEVDRFCIMPSRQKKNFASWFLSRASKEAFKQFSKVSCLVSFADATHGHVGTIYKAANWTEVGKVKPDYCWVNEDGWIVHKKTLYNRAVKMGMRERQYAELHGYKKSYGKHKTKFVLNQRICENMVM